LKIIVRSPASDPASREIEIVERKGLGHPDTICDALAEEISLALCHYYLQHFGRILHHNVDKILLVGGAARPTFGGGDIAQPIEIYLAGRATSECRGESIPVQDLALDACRHWLRQNLPNLDVDRGVRITSRIRPGSVDLSALFDRDAAIALANDTSIGCGFAPFTELERVVLEVERTLNGPDARGNCPAIGQDIKVMGVRHGSEISLTIACAFIDRYTADLDAYLAYKAHVQHLARDAAARVARLPIDVAVNRADDPARGSVYLTVTGTSAEAGDDGEVGRGNRTSGLITPYRVMSTEAAAGKNPLTHVGKLYNVMASRIAATLVDSVAGITSADCVLVSEIGHPVADPATVDVAVSGPSMSKQLQATVVDVVKRQISRISELTDAFMHRRVSVF
jgi:S-adenosylmethionine synthetase